MFHLNKDNKIELNSENDNKIETLFPVLNTRVVREH